MHSVPRRSACDCGRDLVGSSNAKHDKHPGRTVQVRKTWYLFNIVLKLRTTPIKSYNLYCAQDRLA